MKPKHTPILLLLIILATGCTTATGTISKSSMEPQIEQKSDQSRAIQPESENTTDLQANPEDVSCLIPILYPGLETDEKLFIPVEYQDENGLFLFVERNFVEEGVDFYTENWTRGYAGYYFPEDLEERSIKGYGITLPLQIYGNWSTRDEEYFETTTNPWSDRETPKFKIYYGAIVRTRYGINYREKTPYYVFDKLYTEMISNDTNLTIDEKLELIILNHKGYLENLYNNIKPLIDLKYDPKLMGTEKGFTDIYLYMGGPDHFNVGCWESALEDPNFAIRLSLICTGLEILKYRMAPIYHTQFKAPNNKDVELILTNNEGSRAAFNYIGGTTQWRASFSRNNTFSFEFFYGILIHELTHGAIRSGNIEKMGVRQEEIDWFNEPRYNSEVITCLNTPYLFEVLNGTPYSLTFATDIFSWDNYKGEYYEDNNEALMHFFRFIRYTPIEN